MRLDQGTELPLGKLGQLVDDIEIVVLNDRDGCLLDGRPQEQGLDGAGERVEELSPLDLSLSWSSYANGRALVMALRC